MRIANMGLIGKKILLSLGLVAMLGGTTHCVPTPCLEPPRLENGRPAYICEYVDESNQIAAVNLEDLINYPTAYEGTRIQVKGYAEYIREENHFLIYLLPYYDPATETVKLNTSISEVTLTTHHLHTKNNISSPYFVIVDREGGMPLYLPLPVTFTPSSGNMYKDEILVRGMLQKNDDSGYILKMDYAKELK